MNKEILAVVAGEEITKAELDTYLQGVPREQQAYASNPAFREQFLEQLVSLYLFAKKGEENKLTETEEFQRVMANAKREILAQFAMRELLKDVSVEADEVQAFYDLNKAQFQKGESVCAKHILVDTEDECNEILAKVTNGEMTFEAAAKEFSKCPSGQNGGDLGEFGKGQMVPEFEQAAFAAELGQVVGPVVTQFGAHLIKVEAKSAATVAALEEVEEQIRQHLLQQKQHQVYTTEISELKAKYMEK